MGATAATATVGAGGSIVVGDRYDLAAAGHYVSVLFLRLGDVWSLGRF